MDLLIGEHVTEKETNFLRDHVATIENDNLLFASSVKIQNFKKKRADDYKKALLGVSTYRFILCKHSKYTKVISVSREYKISNLAKIHLLDRKDTVDFYFYNTQISEKGDGPDSTESVSIVSMGIDKCIPIITEHYSKINYGITEHFIARIVDNIEKVERPICKKFENVVAGGFEWAYTAYSAYNKVGVNVSFTDYVHNLFEQGNKELNLNDCPGIWPDQESSLDLMVLGESLAHNTYFNSIKITNIACRNMLSSIAQILKYNSNITKLVVRNTESVFPVELGHAFSNSYNCVQILDVSGSMMSGSSIQSFLDAIRKINHPIKVLSLANCGLSDKFLSVLFGALRNRWAFSLSLEELNISGNKFSESSLAEFCSWLSDMRGNSTLSRLAVSGCNIGSVSFFESIKLFMNLNFLDVSNNDLSKIDANLWVDLLTVFGNLEVLNMSNTCLSARSFSLILSFLHISMLTSVKVNFNKVSSNLRNVDFNILKEIDNTHTLDISNNGLRLSTASNIVESIGQSMTQLYIGGNVGGKESQAFVTQIVNVCLTHPNLKLLSLKGKSQSKLRNALELLSTLLSNANCNLVELDISKNSAGDNTMSKIFSSLRSNSKLRVLSCYGNKMSENGYLMVAQLLSVNTTLVKMDLIQYNSIDNEFLTNIMERISFSLQRNRLARTTGTDDDPLGESVFDWYNDWPIPSPGMSEFVLVPEYLIDSELATNQATSDESLLQPDSDSTVAEADVSSRHSDTVAQPEYFDSLPPDFTVPPESIPPPAPMPPPAPVSTNLNVDNDSN